jgi:Fur family transcriptional regulator, peroxide stress response regulator
MRFRRDQVVEILREKGVKITPQRLAIIDYLERHRVHPSAEDVYQSLLPQYPMISLATVYNTLDLLQDLQVIIKLTIDDKKVNYEYDVKPHDHFFCMTCGNIFDIPAKHDDVTVMNGHMIEQSFVYYKGVCRDCLASNK